MKITKLGHCCLVIDIDGVRFLTDPGNYTTAQNDVTNIDYVVISHEHTDHLHIESLKLVLANNPSAQVICNAAVGAKLDAMSIPYTKLSDREEALFAGVKVSAYGTKHAPIYREYEQVENTGYLFGGALYYPGDAFHHPQVPVDILALPVTGPWNKISEVIDYALAIKPRVAFPVHDGNLKTHGITNRLPGIFLPQAGIQYLVLELGKETDIV